MMFDDTEELNKYWSRLLRQYVNTRRCKVN